MNDIVPRDLPKDLRDVRFYLERKFPDSGPIPIYAERHYGAQPHEIACVVIGLPERALRRQVRGCAEAALRHLGFEIENRGFDVYDVWPDKGEISAHDRLRAVARFRGLESDRSAEARAARSREPGRPNRKGKDEC